MNKGISIAILSLVLFFIAQPGFASDAPSASIRTMATILNYLNHYPGDADKPKLKEIADNANAPEYERVLANAILNLEHKANAADKPKLAKIKSDSGIPQAARDLASIVHDLNHKPSSGDKATLKKYMW